MPGANELLWTYINTKQYSEAIKFIQDNPIDLNLNEINKQNQSFLMALLRIPNQQDPGFILLTRSIITSNKFTVAARHIHPFTQSNAFSLAIMTANTALIKEFLKYPEKLDLIYSGRKLQYSIAKECIKSQQALLEDPELADKAQNKIYGLNEILTNLRDFTIRHAIDADDSNLLQALEDADAKPSSPLSDGTFPIILAEPKSKVFAWFNSNADQAMTKVSGANSLLQKLAKDNQEAQDKAAKKFIENIKEGYELISKTAKRVANA